MRTHSSCYPRVSVGFAVIQSLKFIFGAVAPEMCGQVERSLGMLKASAIVAGALLEVTVLLTVVLWRFKAVEMIPFSAMLR